MFRIEDIESVLEAVPEYEEGHHLGRPFVTAYQLAILFAERFSTHASVVSFPIGGAGTGQYQSLAQQIARFLSQKIRNGRSGRIEGGFLSHQHIASISFSSTPSTVISPSTLHSETAHSIFRLRT